MPEDIINRQLDERPIGKAISDTMLMDFKRQSSRPRFKIESEEKLDLDMMEQEIDEIIAKNEHLPDILQRPADTKKQAKTKAARTKVKL